MFVFTSGTAGLRTFFLPLKFFNGVNFVKRD